ncbi:MAG: nucleotide-binding protein [Bacillus sp. (in: firmicutes)]
MNKQQKIELIDDLIIKVEQLGDLDSSLLDALKRESSMIMKNILKEPEEYDNSLRSLRFTPSVYPASTERRVEVWRSGKQKLLNLLVTVKREIELFGGEVSNTEQFNEVSSHEQQTRKVFIVHGHDEAMKLDVARTLEKLKLEAVILHEQEDRGQTVIEKFENNAIDCGFAVILLSPDDIGYPKGEQESSKFRARQNVILELGYFVGAIGRSNVLPLVKDDPSGKLEIPSDYAGVVYTPYDSSGGWKNTLFRELRSSGFSVDANDMF